MIKINKVNELLEYLKTTPIAKHTLNYTWISGSQTTVYPVEIYTGNKSNSAGISIQLESNRNYFNKVLAKVKQFDIVDYAYYDKGDNTVPCSIHIKLKGQLEKWKHTMYYCKHNISIIKGEL